MAKRNRKGGGGNGLVTGLVGVGFKIPSCEWQPEICFFIILTPEETNNIESQGCGQITTTSAEVTPNGGLVREFPPNPLNSGLGIIVICPEGYCFVHFCQV